MKRTIIALMSGLFFCASFAQQNINIPVPEKRPQVGADGSVTFTISAPKAEEVKLAGGIAAYQNSAVRNAEGVWTFVVDSVASDLYDYWFEVDGVRTLDPSNPYVARDIASLANIFIVPGGQGDLFMGSDVPHGTVEKIWYDSEKLGGERRMSVYLPAAYQKDPERRFPVLYLLHGMGGDEDAWLELGRAMQILDNEIASGAAEPMIVVMPNGNGLRKAAPGFTAEGMYLAEGSHSVAPDGKFENSFPEIMRFVEENFRVIPDKEHRAIAGLSMGGGHSWRISMLQPNDFDYIGLFSPAVRWNGGGVDSESPDTELVEKLKVQFADAPKVYEISIGSEDFLYDLNDEYRKLLDSNGFAYQYVESPGGHTWANWRHYLADFLPKLFK